MNLLDSRKAGLIALLALFLFACESDNLITPPLNPDTGNLNAYYKEIKVPFRLVQLDSINTTSASNTNRRLLVGNYVNANSGRIQITGYSSFLPPSSRPAIAANATFDSLALIMVNSYAYGSSAPQQPQTIAIHRLTNALPLRSHYSMESVPYNPGVLGRLTFTPDPAVGSTAENLDTLTVKLSDALGQDMFNRAKSNASEISSDSLFQIYFRGLAFVSETENNYASGFTPSQLRMVLYYSAPADTVSSSYTFSPALTFNNIAYDRSGTALAGITQPLQTGQPADGRFYLESGTGLAPILNFQPLVDFVDSIKENSATQNILLSQATLYIGQERKSQGIRPPAAISGYYFNTAFRRQVLPSNTANSVSYYGLYTDANLAQNSVAASNISADTLSRYRQPFTRYMQFLVDGDTSLSRKEVLLLAPDFEASLNQLVTDADSVMLKIYYTTLE